MFDNYEMTLIRIEGLGDLSNSTCNLFINNEPFESLPLVSLENAQHVSSIPSKSLLKIQVEEKSVLASLQFPLRIIKCQGYHWLPLFTDENDSVEEVPEEVGLPRILLIFQSRKFLSPVIEITETSELSENVDFVDFSEENSKNVELRMKIIELEQNLQFERISQAQNVEKMTREYKGLLDSANFEMEKFKAWSGKYKEKCLSMSEELEEKDKQMGVLMGEKEGVEKELFELKEKYKELLKVQEKASETLEVNEKELMSLKSLAECRKKTLEITKTESLLFPTKKKNKLLKLENSPENQDPLDSSTGSIDYHLQDSLSHLKLEGLFQKTTETFYRVGCKKVGIILKNKSIYCKFGDTLKTLENFIYTHCSNEIENFIKKRANSKPSHHRFKTFSGSFDQSLVSRSFKADNAFASTQVINKSSTPCRSKAIPVKAKVI